MNIPQQRQKPLSQGDIAGDQLRAQRVAIDLVATLRARSLRLGLMVSMQNGMKADPPDWIKSDLELQSSEILEICNALLGSGQLPGIAPDLSAWIIGIASERPNFQSSIRELRSRSEKLVAAADQNLEIAAIDRQVTDYAAFSIGPFFDSVTLFCGSLWQELENDRSEDLKRATETVAALSNRLSRFEHIGKHVRLVSLNASVEAARAGEAGRGLLIIAQEFKTLAEEIQSLAVHAREDMTRLT